MFSPIRFVKFKDPFSYQSSVRNRLERDTFTHNVFSLSFGKHVAAYKSYMEAQDYLSKKSQDTKILIRALRHLPRLKNVTVVFDNEVIGAREIMSAFRLLNGNEVTLDSEYTLPVLVEALSESERTLDIFNLVSDDDNTSIDLYCMSRRDFNDKHQPHFKYASETPANVTVKAFWKAFHRDSKIRQKVIRLMEKLRQFTMSGLEMDCSDLFVFDQWSCSLEPVVASASNLEELVISPRVSETFSGDTPKLSLSSILYDSTRFHNLRSLTLKHVQSTESLLVALFMGCSCSLISAALLHVRVTGSGSWSGVFRQLRTANFDVLYDFVLLHCGEAKGVVRAQDYLKRITNKDPIAECNEKQNNDSD